jgi:branched-chain amino acid transport system permease protein
VTAAALDPADPVPASRSVTPGRAVAGAGAAVAVWVALGTDLVLARRTPLGIIVLGLVLGGLYALMAIGIVLVYRTNRIINFAHGEMGAFAAVLTAQLVANDVGYFAAAGIGIASGVVAAGLIELLVIRRFANAPRLILTVATIALSSLLIFAELSVPRLFGEQVLAYDFRTPLSDLRFGVSPVTFDGNHVAILVVVVAVVIGLGRFLRSSFGIAVRASAENRDRAALCGIPTKGVSTAIWAIAGGLSAAAAIMQAPVTGLQVGILIGPGLLLRALAAAVIGRMTSLPVTVAAAMGLAVVEQSVFWSYGRSTVMDAALLVVILVALLVQRHSLARTEEGASWKAVAAVRPIPAELARLRAVVWARAGLVAAVVVAAVAIPPFLTSARQNLLAVIVIYCLVGLSLVVLSGWAGQISLGQFALVGIGGAVAGSLSQDAGWDLVLSVLAGGIGGAVAALVLGLPALRIRGFFLAVSTLAFAVSTASFLLRQEWLVPSGTVGRPRLFGRADLEIELTFYYLALALLVLTVVGLRGLRRSRIGRAIVAVRDNQRTAQAYGINAVVAKLVAFAASGFIAGVAGALLVHHQHGLPATQYSPQQSLSVFLITVIGGLGSVPGAILGAVYIKGTQYLLAGPWSFFASGFGVLVLLLVLPDGLGALLFRIRDAYLRWLATRRGIVVASLVADLRVPDEDDELVLEDGETVLGFEPVTA